MTELEVFEIEFEDGYVIINDPDSDVFSPRLIDSWKRKLGRVLATRKVIINTDDFPLWGIRIYYAYKENSKRNRKYEMRMQAKQEARMLLENQTLLTQFMNGQTLQETINDVKKRCGSRYKKLLKKRFG